MTQEATAVALVPSQVDPEVSAAMVLYERIAPLQQALGLADHSVAEIQLFAMVAHRLGLDPFARQIYSIKRKGKCTHQVGIDGFRSVAENTRQYAGSDEAEFEECDCGQEPKGHPKLSRVVVHRIMPGGHVVDQVGIARWHELYPGGGDDGFMWRKMPFGQLSKCAEANGLRKAFPRVLSGVYIPEEMQQADAEAAAETEARRVASLPSAADRLAARRAAIEAPTGQPVRDEDLLPATPDADPATGEVIAATAAATTAGCGWKLGRGRGQAALDCTYGEMHGGKHSWDAIATSEGGRVIRPD